MYVCVCVCMYVGKYVFVCIYIYIYVIGMPLAGVIIRSSVNQLDGATHSL